MERKTGSLIGVLAFIVLLYVTFRLLQFPAGLFTATFVGGLVVWLFTTFRVPVNPQKMIVPHLVAVMLFIVHVYEEFATHIKVVMTRLTGVHVSQEMFLTIYIHPNTVRIFWQNSVCLRVNLHRATMP